MQSNTVVGGEVAVAHVRDRRAQSEKMLVSIFGKFVAASILADKKLLPLLLPVLQSDGKDQAAIAALRQAIFVPPRVPIHRGGTSAPKRPQSDCSEAFLSFANA